VALAGFEAPFGSQWLLAKEAVPVTAAAAIVAAVAGADPTQAPPGRAATDVAADSHPLPEAPGPNSGGSSGGAAAGSGSGTASPTSSTLLGMPQRYAPWLTRRLRLARVSWRTSFFVLIPERPD
jgi:hypothetical protein